MSNQSFERDVPNSPKVGEVKPSPEKIEETATSSEPSKDGENPMTEYYQLQKMLYGYTLAITGIIFPLTWYLTSLNTALNYLLGAIVSVFYLRFLAQDVERLGQQPQRLGGKGLGMFVIMMLAASKLQQLHILPVFLGFLTYKGAIVIYTLQTLLLPQEQESDRTIAD